MAPVLNMRLPRGSTRPRGVMPKHVLNTLA